MRHHDVAEYEIGLMGAYGLQAQKPVYRL
jgi:hypothetical protein